MKRTTYIILISLLAVVGCRDMGHTPGRNDEGQVLDLSVSIEDGASKAPIEGAAFADGTHLFGLAVTKADGVTAYEAGAGNVWASAVVAGAAQTWTYKWGSMSAAGTVLPLLYGGDPMQVAGYYPYNLSAGIEAGRDAGRLNVPFDLTTPAELSNQTDVLYSGVQSVGYATGARQSVALSFRHVYALLEFQVKLKQAGVAASITKVEVCNKAGQTFLSNKGFFSPYTGALTASTAGNVSLTTSTALNGSTYATIRVLVPPTLLAGYADGDIYVQMYDNGTADPKQFPILQAYLTQSGTYGLVGGGRYTYKLLYDNTAFGSITVVDWSSTVVADETLGSGPPPYVVIDGLRWAVGNLIADGANGCKIGAPTDYGVYFKFGSLVGWNGGANGNGVGTGSATATAVHVKPATYGGTSDWGTVGRYTDAGTVSTGYGLPTTDAPTSGIGDPCRYYLGAPWRTPTAAEYGALVGVGYGGWGTSPGVGRWFGLSPGTVSSSVFFPAAGFRHSGGGGVFAANETGDYWSSSVFNASQGYNLWNTFQGGMAPQGNTDRPFAFPVRCVQPVPTVPNPPAASDYVTIGSLNWTKGNLIAVNGTNAKVGAPEDGGLYFQFGSLVGWTGGATGNGVGTGDMTALGVQVKPATYGGGELWTTVGYYKEGTTNDKGYNLPTTDDRATGVGDPCRVYLGAPWRTPTADEYGALDGDGRGGWLTSPGAGRWFGENPGTVSSSVFFPASGYRHNSSGALINVGSEGNYWSSSVINDTDGYFLYFLNSNVYPQYDNGRNNGHPVRCVQPVPTVPTTPNPPAASDYVTIGSLNWTKGNLVAVNGTNAKVGAPEDGGLYFQFGSLVGWTGGATGNGVGTGEPVIGVRVKPSTYGGSSDWTAVGRYTDAGTAGTGNNVLETDVPMSGIGDPCRVYLGAPWRTPTAAEYGALDGAGRGGWVTSPGAGRWFGLNPGTVSSSVFFPASGIRYGSDGATFDGVGFGGACWSSSVSSVASGYGLTFSSSVNVSPQNLYNRSMGLPVRCVQPVPTTPNPPAASDYVTIGSLKWTKGNLVAVNGTNAKVGAPTDYGLYFQFGSLVGWNGGATGNGVGTGSSSALAVQVKPATYSGGTAWTTVGYYKDGDEDDKKYNLPTTDAPTSGIGDPCRVYLGAPWRTPTAVEYLTLLGTDGANTNKAVPLKLPDYDLSFPASGYRDYDDGAFGSVGSYGSYWSSSVNLATEGYFAYFTSGLVDAQNYAPRSIGLPVRCVSN